MQKGLTLIEVIVATALIAISLFIIASIIPTGILSLKKGEDYQSASALGMSLIEEVRSEKPHHSSYPVTDIVATRELNNTLFTLQRDIYALDQQSPPRFFDVIVTIGWNRQPVPLRLSTRLFFRE